MPHIGKKESMKHPHLEKHRIYRLIICILMTSSILASQTSAAEYDTGELYLLARAASIIVSDENASSCEFSAKVSVCAVLLNRMHDSGYPDTLAAVISGLICGDAELCAAYTAAKPSDRSLRAAAAALRGADPTRGALLFERSELVNEDIRASGRVCFEVDGIAFILR